MGVLTKPRFVESIKFLGLVLALFNAGTGTAFAFHEYSQADESGFVNHYTGLSVTRPDRSVDQASTGCSSYYSGNPVYQTQWVLITSDAQNWLELGTGHQCADAKRFWFWGYGYLGDWYPQGEVGGVDAGVTHTFRVVRSGGTTWTWRIDGTARGSLTWAEQGARVRTGLESWGSAAVASKYNQSDLMYTLDQGLWTDWSGFDGSKVGTPEMCGGWNTATSWRSSENSPC
jgi:hypothetical protein